MRARIFKGGLGPSIAFRTRDKGLNHSGYWFAGGRALSQDGGSRAEAPRRRGSLSMVRGGRWQSGRWDARSAGDAQNRRCGEQCELGGFQFWRSAGLES